MDWWTQLPAWVRYPISLGLIAIAIGALSFADRIPVRGVGAVFGLGIALLLIGPSDSDKNGYRF